MTQKLFVSNQGHQGLIPLLQGNPPVRNRIPSSSPTSINIVTLWKISLLGLNTTEASQPALRSSREILKYGLLGLHTHLAKIKIRADPGLFYLHSPSKNLTKYKARPVQAS